MNFLNKQQIIGNIGQDAVIKKMPNGDPVTTINVAATESWKDKSSGDWVHNTTWFRVVCYNKTAEYVVKNGKKGTQVFIEGKTRNTEWTENNIKRYGTEVVCKEFQVLKQAKAQNSKDSSQDNNSNNDENVFPSEVLELLELGVAIKLSKNEENFAQKKKILSEKYNYTWKASAQEWSPKAS